MYGLLHHPRRIWRRVGPQPRTSQKGQALVEGLVVIALLAAFWLAIGWLGRLQDIGMAAQHASSLAAFLYTRSPAVGRDATFHADNLESYFSGPAHQWRDVRGQRLLRVSHDTSRAGKALTLSPGRADVSFSLDQSTSLPPLAQPGGKGEHAAGLRSDWRINDEGVLTARVQARTVRAVFDALPPPLINRHTAVLSNAGHASNAAMASHRLAGSRLGWRSAADQSLRAGRSLRSVLSDIEQGWSRPLPEFDWIGPWAGRIPAGLLRSQASSGHTGVRPRAIRSSGQRGGYGQ